MPQKHLKFNISQVDFIIYPKSISSALYLQKSMAPLASDSVTSYQSQ